MEALELLRAVPGSDKPVSTVDYFTAIDRLDEKIRDLKIQLVKAGDDAANRAKGMVKFI